MAEFGAGLRYCKCGHEETLHFKPGPLGTACSYCGCKAFVDRNAKPAEPVKLQEDWNG
jgi:hypothetical protein